jgi:carboxypeptidase family protein
MTGVVALSCRTMRAWAIALAALCGMASRLHAQGPTTAAIAGRISDAAGHGVAGADIVVTNRATGASMRSTSRADGHYEVAGLEVGGPYAVTVRHAGSRPRTQTGFLLSLGQRLRLDVQLAQQAATLPAVVTAATQDRRFSRSHMGTESFLSDSAIHHLPVISRDLYDFVRLVPQVSTWFASTATGANTRVNSIRIDGISDQVISSNLAAGALYGGKVIPLDAVKEYQVLLSPFSVQHGGFAGASVNVVTRSGTNDLKGSVFAYGTNERLGPNVPFVRSAPYDKAQIGFSLGGPIIRDRLHFYLASELLRRSIPAQGPYVGSRPSSQMLPVSADDVARFQQLLSARGLDAGSAGAVANPNPSASTFLRLDAPIPAWNSRLTVRGTYGYGDSAIFARPTLLAPTNCTSSTCFPLSSLQHSRWVNKRSSAVQLVTNFANGAYNEVLAGYTGIISGFRPTVKEPLVLVTVPAVSGGPAVLQAGTHEIATGQRNASWTTDLTDNFVISLGVHRIMAGLSMQRFDLKAFQLRGAYGVWEFASLDSLAAGTAARYRVTRDTGSVTAASGMHHALYLGDEWTASSRLSLTFGLRAEVPMISARPPYVPAVDSAFGLRTDAVPSARVHWSPRLGFNYDLTGDDATPTQLRGGVGLFTGRPPLFWLFGGFSAYGLAQRTLQCGPLPSDAGAAPPFSTDASKPPFACAGGQTFGGATTAEVDVLAPRLRLPQVLRSSLAVDRALPFGFVGTIEGIVTRSTSTLYFSGINLAAPQGTDRRGRVMYGTVATSGVATPRRIVARLGDVVSVTNQSRDIAYDITGELRREGRLADLQVAVSYGRTRDVASPRPVSALLVDDWRYGRPVAGRLDDVSLGTSDYDQPVRVRMSGTLRSPWRRLGTDLSLYYIGGSGFPYTYVAGGTQGRGDLNGDGAQGNDPLYIPHTTFDTAEIRFAGTAAEVTAQQNAFDRFIDDAACLREQRGRIMSRNSCRSPWLHQTNVALRQTLPAVATHVVALEVQVFNLLNLLNRQWGRMQLPAGTVPTTTNQIPLLSQVGETSGTQAQPIYRFDAATQRYQSENTDSFYQIQLALRYSF